MHGVAWFVVAFGLFTAGLGFELGLVGGYGWVYFGNCVLVYLW